MIQRRKAQEKDERYNSLRFDQGPSTSIDNALGLDMDGPVHQNPYQNMMSEEEELQAAIKASLQVF